MTGAAEGTVDRVLRARALSAPAGRALVTDPGAPGGTLRWADLERRSGELACPLAGLVRSGAQHAQVAVQVASDNTMESLLLLVAALRTDIPVVLTDESAPAAEQEAVREELRRNGISIVARGGSGIGLDLASAPAGATLPGHALPGHALLLPSGGSTGRPKLVVDSALRRAGAQPARLRVTARLNWTADQVQLVTGRLHHAAPLTFFLHGLIDGNCLVVPSRFVPSAALALIEDQRVAWLEAAPVHLGRMAAWQRRRPAELGSLRGMLHMSAPCPPAVKRFWIDQLGPERVFEIYGASEGIGVTVASGQEWLDRPGTVGRGFLTQLRILDENMAPQPPGGGGLVFMRSLAGIRSARLGGSEGVLVSPDGFRSVGDRGRVDADGYLYLEPRQVDMINVGGQNVYPAEVERVLAQYPGVADAAVTGVPDDRMGARPVAFVSRWPEAELTEREIIAFCGKRLARFKLPKTVYFVADIPHTTTGKIDRKKLLALVATP